MLRFAKLHYAQNFNLFVKFINNEFIPINHKTPMNTLNMEDHNFTCDHI